MLNVSLLILTFIAMEGVAWFTHRFVMHGFLWYLHEDHHLPRKGVFEKNDAFFLVFAVPSFLLTFLGAKSGFDFRFFIGLGIALYGAAYFLIHDVLIHRRFKWFDNTDNFYFRSVRKIHKLHHKKQGKYDGAYFGMLWIPIQYLTKK